MPHADHSNNRSQREVGFLKDERRLNGMKCSAALTTGLLTPLLSGYDSRTSTSREQSPLRSRYNSKFILSV